MNFSASCKREGKLRHETRGECRLVKTRNQNPTFASRLRDFADAVLNIRCKGMGNFV